MKTMIRILGIALAAGLATTAFAEAASLAVPGADDLRKLVPSEIQGWKADGQDRAFDFETIFDSIDGAGEVYRAYNMKSLLSRRYARKSKPDLIADVFDMGSSADAYGVFTHDPEGEDWDVGQGSVYKGGLLSFWRDRFFVSLYAESETGETKAALLDLGRRVESAIGRDGIRPSLPSVLPAAYADPKRVHYFHSPVILNYHFFVSAANILELDPSAEGLLGKAADKSAVVVVRYPVVARAAAALKTFLAAFMPDAKKPGLVQTEDKTWTAAASTGRAVAVVFHARTADAARTILDEIKAKLNALESR